jgi:two-component system sensor histidine kinase/response regulator
MPENWVVEVRHAASQGTEDAILELLEQIPVELALLARALEDLANEFQFEAIMELTEMVNS